MNNRLFGERLAALRKEKGLTQAQLAEILNVSNKTISRWETAEGYPEITLLVPLAKALGVTVDELLAEEGDEKANPQPDAEFGSAFSSSAFNSENIYKGKKETKHRDIPVAWPSFKSGTSPLADKFHAISNVLHILYFSVFTFILIDGSRYINYTDKPYTSGIGNQIGAGSGAGNFFMANEGLTWLIAMIISLIILIIFNIYGVKSERQSKVLLVRNLVISTILTAAVIIFGCSLHTGTYRQYQSVGVTVDKIFDLAPGSIISCDCIKIEPAVIAICGIAACSVYIIWEIIRIIVAYRKKKQCDADGESEIVRTSSKYIEFWRSLTIFNKIALGCILADILIIFTGLVLSITVGYVFTATIMLVITSNVAKVGLIACITGLILGLLDLYDRQNSGAVVMIILNLIFMYVLPLMLFLFNMTIATKEIGVADIIANVNII